MPNGMAGHIQDVEAAVAEEVVGLEFPDHEFVAEVDFPDCTTLKLFVVEGRVLSLGEAGHESFLETRAYYHLGGFGKEGHVARMIPVPMADDHGVDLIEVGSALLEDLDDVLVNLDAWDGGLDSIVDVGWEVPPVQPAAQVEHGLLPRFVLNEEGVGGAVEDLMAFDSRLDQGNSGTRDLVSGVDHVKLAGVGGLWNIEPGGLLWGDFLTHVVRVVTA